MSELVEVLGRVPEFVQLNHSRSLRVIYQVSSYYDGSDTRAVAWDDPDLAIAWPTKAPVLSERDRSNPTLRKLFPDLMTRRRSATASGIVAQG